LHADLSGRIWRGERPADHTDDTDVGREKKRFEQKATKETKERGEERRIATRGTKGTEEKRGEVLVSVNLPGQIWHRQISELSQ